MNDLRHARNAWPSLACQHVGNASMSRKDPRIKSWAAAVALFLANGLSHANDASVSTYTFPPNEAIRDLLVQRIDVNHQAVGMVVGVIDASGSRIVSYGFLDKENRQHVDGSTVFEIGSLTKLFTSLLLADAAEKGELSLNAPVARYLPGLRIPERGRAMTLQDLALHISGLPRDPPPIARTPAEHFAAYDLPQLRRFLETYTLDRGVGEKFEYSNLGVGLLGLALEGALGKEYQDLIRERITGPLGMEDTSEIPSRRMRAHLSEGHDGDLDRVPPSSWSHPYRAAGSLRSTASDLLKFLGAQLGLRSTALQPAFARLLAVRHETGTAGLEAALGWSVATDRGLVIDSLSGTTAGFTTFIGFEPNLKLGIVVLSNALASVSPDDIGLHLLNPRYKLVERFSNQ